MGCTSIGGLTVRTIQGVQYLETEEELLQALFCHCHCQPAHALRQQKRNTLSNLSNRTWRVASNQARIGARSRLGLQQVVCRLEGLEGLDAHAQGATGRWRGVPLFSLSVSRASVLKFSVSAHYCAYRTRR